MSPKDLSAQPVLTHGKQSRDRRTGYIEHAEELINYHTFFGGRELGASGPSDSLWLPGANIPHVGNKTDEAPL